MRLMSRFMLIALVALGAAGCASTALDEHPAAAPASLPDSSEEAEGYRLQFGDTLEIRFFYNPELNATVPIRPDGWISLDLIGEIKAAGLTPAELSEQLSTRSADRLRHPDVTVIVSGFSDRRVYVGGEVRTPRSIQLTRDVTPIQAIIEAGGFKPSAHLGNVIVLRDQGSSEPLFFTLDYAQTVKKGIVDPGHQAVLKLQPNDVVFVPKTRVARWGQLVDQYFNELVPISLSMGLTYIIGDTTTLQTSGN